MNDSTTAQLLGLAIATALATAFGVLWRRRLISIIRALALQGGAVASVALLLGFDRRSFEPIVAAVLVFALKAVLIPVILARRVRQTEELREVDPVVNIPTSLLAGGFLGLRMGPRILRTETAALAAIAALQSRFGDFH